MRRALLAMSRALGLAADAVEPPPQMMANVYRLTEAAAVLTVCVGSPSYKELPGDKAAHLSGQLARIGELVRNMAKYYKDAALHETYERTKARIASEPQMQGYVKGKYQYCGDALIRDMEAYVAENEKLINAYLAGPPAAAKKP